MTELLESIRSHEESGVAREVKVRAAALDQYRQIVHRAAAPEQADAASLRSIMAKLGLSAADFEGDIAALADEQSLQEKLTVAREASARADVPAARSSYHTALRDFIVEEIQSINEGGIGLLSVLAQTIINSILPKPGESKLRPEALKREQTPSRLLETYRDCELAHRRCVDAENQARYKLDDVRERDPRLFSE